MVCNKKYNLKKGWNRYCTGMDILGKIPLIGKAFKNDTFFGLYLGCACKEHDLNYSKHRHIDKKTADFIFKKEIRKQAKIQNKPIAGFFAEYIFYKLVVLFGFVYYNKEDLSPYPRYK